MSFSLYLGAVSLNEKMLTDRCLCMLLYAVGYNARESTFHSSCFFPGEPIPIAWRSVIVAGTIPSTTWRLVTLGQAKTMPPFAHQFILYSSYYRPPSRIHRGQNECRTRFDTCLFTHWPGSDGVIIQCSHFFLMI